MTPEAMNLLKNHACKRGLVFTTPFTDPDYGKGSLSPYLSELLNLGLIKVISGYTHTYNVTQEGNTLAAALTLIESYGEVVSVKKDNCDIDTPPPEGE